MYFAKDEQRRNFNMNQNIKLQNKRENQQPEDPEKSRPLLYD